MPADPSAVPDEPLADDRRGVAYLYEESEPGGWSTGLVLGHWESDPEGPSDDDEELGPGSVDDAIAWGRARAKVVVLTLGSDRYSVGTHTFEQVEADDPEPVDPDEDEDDGDDDDFLPWPDGGIVLEPRYDYEPAGMPRAGAWWVRVSRDRLSEGSADDFARLVATHDRVLSTRIVDPGPPGVIDVLVTMPLDGPGGNPGFERVDVAVYRAIARVEHLRSVERGDPPRALDPQRTRWVAVEQDRGDRVEILGPGTAAD
ncbi:MAG: hypothetical protein REI11_03920 [Patulibacter sp.]|nr:hypothetical protein [Patulibacter sp.]